MYKIKDRKKKKNGKVKFRNKRKINRWSPSLFSSSITYIKGNWSVEKIICQTISIHLKGGKKKEITDNKMEEGFFNENCCGDRFVVSCFTYSRQFIRNYFEWWKNKRG